MTPEEFAAAGLYDPAAPDAADCLALLAWLDDRGFTVDDIRAAMAEGRMTALAGDRELLGAGGLSLRDIGELSGLGLDVAHGVVQASGLPAQDPDERCFATSDVATFVLFAAARSLFSEDEILHFTRVLGSCAARVADAANSLFLNDVERRLADRGEGTLALAEANLAASGMVMEIGAVLGTLTRLHLRRTNDRFRAAVRAGSCGAVEVSVGFVDLCGFTARSADLTPEELAEVIRRFEEQAYDVVAAADGRVVKLIGDEVMFMALDPDTACRIALGLTVAFAGSDLMPRGGVAHGAVVARGGDYYGPIVNLASRLADLAVPGEILATPEVAAGAPAHRFEPAGRRQLKGFAEPLALVSLLPT